MQGSFWLKPSILMSSDSALGKTFTIPFVSQSGCSDEFPRSVVCTAQNWIFLKCAYVGMSESINKGELHYTLEKDLLSKWFFKGSVKMFHLHTTGRKKINDLEFHRAGCHNYRDTLHLLQGKRTSPLNERHSFPKTENNTY